MNKENNPLRLAFERRDVKKFCSLVTVAKRISKTAINKSEAAFLKNWENAKRVVEEESQIVFQNAPEIDIGT